MAKQTFKVVKILPKSAILQYKNEYQAVVPLKNIYSDISEGKTIEYDENKISEDFKNPLVSFEIKSETKKAYEIEYNETKYFVAKAVATKEGTKIYITEKIRDELNEYKKTNKEEWKKAFKETYHKIKGSKKQDDGSVLIEFPINVKATGQTRTHKETFSPDYCKNGKVLGKNIWGSLIGYKNDPELIWGKEQMPFEYEVDEKAIDEYLTKASDPSTWTDEDLTDPADDLGDA